MNKLLVVDMIVYGVLYDIVLDSPKQKTPASLWWSHSTLSSLGQSRRCFSSPKHLQLALTMLPEPCSNRRFVTSIAVRIYWCHNIMSIRDHDCELTFCISCKSKLSTDNSCFLFVPHIITNSLPLSIIAHLHTSFKLNHSPPIHQSKSILITC